MPRTLGSLLMSFLLLGVTAPANAAERLVFGAELPLAVPAAGWASQAGVGIGAQLRLRYELSEQFGLVARLGYIHHLETSNGLSTSELPLSFGGRVVLGGHFTVDFDALAGWSHRQTPWSDHDRLSVGVAAGIGARFSIIDLRAQLLVSDLPRVTDSFGVFFAVGVDIFELWREEEPPPPEPAPRPRPRPRPKPVEVPPQVVEPPPQPVAVEKTKVEAIPLSGAALVPVRPSSGIVRHGGVTMTLDILDGRDCGGYPQLIARSETEDGEGSVCVADPLTTTHYLAHVRLENQTPHLLYLDRSPLALRRDDGSVIAVGRLPDLWAQWSKLERDTGIRGRYVVRGADGVVRDGVSVGWATKLDLQIAPEVASLVDFDRAQPLFPRETRAGWVVIVVPDHVPLEESLAFGLYDVVAATDRAGVPLEKTAFEVELARRQWSVEGKRVERWTVYEVPAGHGEPYAAPAGSAPEASPGPLPVGAHGVVELDDMLGRLDEITATLSLWMGQPVVVELRNGDLVVGVLSGVRGTMLFLTVEGGARWSGDMLDVERVGRAPR